MTEPSGSFQEHTEDRKQGSVSPNSRDITENLNEQDISNDKTQIFTRPVNNVEIYPQPLPWTQTSDQRQIPNGSQQQIKFVQGQAKVPPLKLAGKNEMMSPSQPLPHPEYQIPVQFVNQMRPIATSPPDKIEFPAIPASSSKQPLQGMMKWNGMTPGVYQSNPNMALMRDFTHQVLTKKNNLIKSNSGYSVGSVDRNSKYSITRQSQRKGVKNPRPNSSQTALGKMSNLRYQSQRRDVHLPGLEVSNERILDAITGQIDSQLDSHQSRFIKIPMGSHNVSRFSQTRAKKSRQQHHFHENIDLDKLDLDNLDCSQLVQGHKPNNQEQQEDDQVVQEEWVDSVPEQPMPRFDAWPPPAQQNDNKPRLPLFPTNAFDPQKFLSEMTPQAATSQSVNLIKEQRQQRLKIQAQVYKQNLSKLANLRRSNQNKTMLNDLPADKNFILKNKEKFSVTAAKKLDRLKKLDAQAKNLKEQRGQSDNIENVIKETEDYLHESIDNILSEGQNMEPRHLMNNTTKVNKNIFDQIDKEDIQSDKTQEQFKNLKFTNKNQNNEKKVARGRKLQKTEQANKHFKSQSQSRSRSNEQRRIDIGKKRLNMARSSIGLRGVSDSKFDFSQSPTRKNCSPMPNSSKKMFELRNSKKQRSQTAGGFGRLGKDIDPNLQRRKQKSAMNKDRILNIVKSSQNIHYQRMSAGKPKKPSHFHHDRVQSSVTTQKLDFKGQNQKSTGMLYSQNETDHRTTKLHQIQSQSVINNNLHFMDESMQDMTSQQLQKSQFDDAQPMTTPVIPKKQNSLIQKSGEFKTKVERPSSKKSPSISFRERKSNKKTASLLGDETPGEQILLPKIPKTSSVQSLQKQQAKPKTPIKIGGWTKDGANDYFPNPDRNDESLKKPKVPPGIIVGRQQSQQTRNRQNMSTQLPPRATSKSQERRINRKNTGGDQSSQRSSLKSSVLSRGTYTKQVRPVYDADGNIVYEPKFRKPKWVLPSEYHRFMKFEDRSLSEENSRNNRIRMEDIFQRMPHINTVFSHIKEKEIAKYILSQSYLEKDCLDHDSVIGIHPDIQSHQLFIDEIRLLMGPPKIQITLKLCKEMAESMLSEFNLVQGGRDPRLADSDLNLKADRNWIVEYHKDDTHIDFWKSYEARKEAKRTLIKQVFKEIFGENKPEWKNNYDPKAFEEELQNNNKSVPNYFKARQQELQDWREIFERRAGFEEIVADMGEPVEDQIRSIIRQQNIQKVEEKERQKIKKNQDDLDWVVNELTSADYLRLPVLEFEPVSQPEQEDYKGFYSKYFKINEQWESRDNLQGKIVKEFKRLSPIITEYELNEQSSFLRSADQQDYEERMTFIKNLLNSEVYDMDKILNDNVYRQKQRNKMISRLSPFDQSILQQKGIEVAFRMSMPHLEIYEIILDNYFTFEKQDLFYYQWYADYIEQSGRKSLDDCPNFYPFAGLSMTMADRQIETDWAKRKIVCPEHFSRNALLESIFYPKFTNLRDEANNLIFPEERDRFWKYFAWFMTKFDGSDQNERPESQESFRQLSPIDDLKSLFFMLHIDFTKDFDVAKTKDDPFPKAFESKLYRLVFRARLLNPIFEEVDADIVPGSLYPVQQKKEKKIIPPLELLEPTYHPEALFQDKEMLHELLSTVIKEKKHKDYQRQKQILMYRQGIRTSKLSRYYQKIQKLVTTRNQNRIEKKGLVRPKSADAHMKPFWKKDKLSELELDFLESLFLSQLSFTEEILLPLKSQNFYEFQQKILKTAMENDKIVMPYKPYLENVECNYLKKLVQRYEDTHDMSRPTSGHQSVMSQTPVKGTSKPASKQATTKKQLTKKSSKFEISSKSIQKDILSASKTVDFRQVAEISKQITLKSAIPDYEVAAYNPEIVREKYKDDCTILVWIEKSIGDQEQRTSDQFLVQPDTSIQLGTLKYEWNFTRVLVDLRKPKVQQVKCLQQMNTDRIMGKTIEQPKLIDQKTFRSTHYLAPAIEGELTNRRTEVSGSQLTKKIEESLEESNAGNIIMRMKEGIPQYLPLHICPDRLQTVCEDCPDEIKAHITNMVKKPQARISKGASLNTTEKVLSYVDKQVRKQLKMAIEDGDYDLLQNYIDQFSKSLTSRTDQLNFQTGQVQEGEDFDEKLNFVREEGIPVEGDTILHFALMMNYDTGKPFLSFDNYYQEIEQELRARKYESMGGTDLKNKDDIMEMRLTISKIKKALSKESQESHRIKEKVVCILLKGGANPNIKNESQISPYDIVKELKHGGKTIMKEIMEQAKQKR